MTNHIFLFFLFSILTEMGCISDSGDADCLVDQIDYVVKTDNNFKLHSEVDLLMVALFEKENGESLKLAVFPKDIFSEYLVGKSVYKPHGFITHKKVEIIFYGDIPEEVDVSPINGSMDYLIPGKKRQVEEGEIPYPPAIIEPYVFSFRKTKECFQIVDQSVATSLLD